MQKVAASPTPHSRGTAQHICNPTDKNKHTYPHPHPQEHNPPNPNPVHSERAFCIPFISLFLRLFFLPPTALSLHCSVCLYMYVFFFCSVVFITCCFCCSNPRLSAATFVALPSRRNFVGWATRRQCERKGKQYHGRC